MTLRQEKITSLLKEIAGSFIKSKCDSDALITVTRSETSPDLKLAKIFISVFPEEKEKTVIGMLKRKSGNLRNYAKSRLKMKFLPFFQFEIDTGEKSRKRIEELLKK